MGGDCTGGSRTDGWDGWIKLGGDGLSWNGSACIGTSDNLNTNRCNYGVNIIANKFGGYAWGGGDAPGVAGVIGWVDFAPKIGGISVGPVIGAPPCTASDPGIAWGSCQALPSSTCAAPLVTKFFPGGGIRVGACPSGGTTTGPCDVTVACTPPATSGPAPTATCNYNGVCNVGETPLNCAFDCKVKYKQF